MTTRSASRRSSHTWASPRRWTRVGAARQGRLPGREELLGRHITVVGSTDPGLVGVVGEVLDETQRTIVVRVDDGRRLVLGKSAVTLRFELDGTDVVVEGRDIVFRPEDRIKKVR